MIVTMLSSGVIDYWDDGDDQPYFYYKNPDTAHSFEGFVSYMVGLISESTFAYSYQAIINQK